MLADTGTAVMCCRQQVGFIHQHTSATLQYIALSALILMWW